MFSSLISSNIYQALSKWALTSKEKNIIIDPLSCFIKIGLLNFYQEGTKISITNNQIKFDEPNYFQGVIRSFNGDGRDDLHNIFNPIQKCIKWYWKDPKYEKEEDSDSKVKNRDKRIDSRKRKISFLFDIAANGLKRLKKSYPSSCAIQYTLDYYIDIIENKRIIHLTPPDEGNDGDNRENNGGDGKVLENLDISVDDNNRIHKFLKKLWNDREIEIICNMFEEFQSKKDKEGSEKDVENIIISITTFTENKERKLNEFLETHTKVLL